MRLNDAREWPRKVAEFGVLAQPEMAARVVEVADASRSAAQKGETDPAAKPVKGFGGHAVILPEESAQLRLAMTRS